MHFACARAVGPFIFGSYSHGSDSARNGALDIFFSFFSKPPSVEAISVRVICISRARARHIRRREKKWHLHWNVAINRTVI